MKYEIPLRSLGVLLFGSAGWMLGERLAGVYPLFSRVLILLAITGGVLGFILTPYLIVHPFVWVRSRVRQLPAKQLLSGSIGLTLGLIIAALLTPPLSQLPGIFGQVLPFVAAIFLGYTGVQVMVLRERDLLNLLPSRFKRTPPKTTSHVLLDTSVIIDGRIADIAKTGFIEGIMLVPNFVLGELQHIAGSRDLLRRQRGKRGLEILEKLQKESVAPLQISDVDAPEINEVDAKLVAIARDMHASVLTTDYNLNKVAELQGVKVLNINELANAVKTLLLPGESFEVDIIQTGREQGQGVGYLEDGTMVVVEQAQGMIGQKRLVEVTRILQTVAGRMIFAQINDRLMNSSNKG